MVLVRFLILLALNWIVLADWEVERFVIAAEMKARLEVIPVINQYGVKNACSLRDCGDFHLVLYYLSPHRARVILRRLDDLKWSYNLSIFISPWSPTLQQILTPCMNSRSFSNLSVAAGKGLRGEGVSSCGGVEGLEEIIFFGSSSEFEIISTINTSLTLFPDPATSQPQKIPKIIIQTFSSRSPLSVYQWMARQTFEDLNPEYDILMLNDLECRKFLKLHFGDYRSPSSRNELDSLTLLEAYDLLISPTFKSDIFRYAYLALHGGCYFDHKMIARKPLRRVILPNDSFLVCSDALSYLGSAPESLKSTQRFYNAVICSQAHDPRIWKTIDSVLRKITLRHQSGPDLGLTGPIAFYEAIQKNVEEENVRFAHGFRKISLSKRRKYEDFYVKEKLSHEIFLTKYYKGFHPDPQLRYGKLWQHGYVYYDQLLCLYPWKLYTFPGQKRCVDAVQSSFAAVTASAHSPQLDAGANSSAIKYLTVVLKPRTLLTQYELFHQDEGTGLCRTVHLQIVHDESSESWKLDIPASDLINSNGTYRIPFHFFRP